MQTQIENRESILRELERILAGAEFRQSEQSKKLLRHLVHVTLEGDADRLRERSIGTQLFGLPPGYDTSQNPIVRVRANEIRKRLTKYYQTAPSSEWRYEIPAGAYRVEFRPPEAPAASAEPVAREESPPALPAIPSPRPTRRWMLAGGAAGFATAAWVGRNAIRRDLDEVFWGPALDSPSPVILCSGHPVVYRLSNEALRRLRGAPTDHYQRQTEELHLGPDLTLKGDEVVAIPDQYIGLGTAEALARIHSWLQRHNKESDIRFGNDLGFTDLRRSPALILGAYQNRWMREFMRGLRLIFTTRDGAPVVRDTLTGRTWHLPNLQENGRTPEDYVLITRLLTSPTGEFLIAAAGITQYGGRTVAEILTDSAVLQRMLQGASQTWASRNLQLLARVEVIGKTAGPPSLITLHEW